jgi:porphobilinogen synthase
MVRETTLSPADFVWPLFLVQGERQKQAIASLPGIHRWTLDLAIEQVVQAAKSGIRAVALFPKVDEEKKDRYGKEALNPQGLIPLAVRELKKAAPGVLVITDVALDPYSSDGHDGIVEEGRIINDASVEILAEMALVQAQAGADLVAPSDMMDGRVGAIRKRLDDAGKTDTGILAYTAKYASGFYGPFRDALGSAPKFGDKCTYQMDPCNAREARRELELDIAEGADIVMVKPAMAYLDIISEFKRLSEVPVAAYQVSGELAMIEAAAQLGWLDRRRILLESLTSIKRAGADMIFTYAALEVSQWLRD